MKRPKPVVGQILYLRSSWDVGKKNPEPRPTKVTAVGRKFFKIDRGSSITRFHIDTWAHDTQCSLGYYLYESLEEFQKEYENNLLYSDIKKLASLLSWNQVQTHSEQAHQVKNLLEEITGVIRRED